MCGGTGSRWKICWLNRASARCLGFLLLHEEAVLVIRALPRGVVVVASPADRSGEGHLIEDEVEEVVEVGAGRSMANSISTSTIATNTTIMEPEVFQITTSIAVSQELRTVLPMTIPSPWLALPRQRHRTRPPRSAASQT